MYAEGNAPDRGQFRGSQPVVEILSDSHLKQACRCRSNRASTVDEVLSKLADLRDVAVGRNEGLVRQHPVHRDTRIVFEDAAELFDGHRVAHTPSTRPKRFNNATECRVVASTR